MSITDEPGTTSDGDPIGHLAATIDARPDEAGEQIAELVDHVEESSRDVEQLPIPPADEALAEETDDDPAVTGEDRRRLMAIRLGSGCFDRGACPERHVPSKAGSRHSGSMFRTRVDVGVSSMLSRWPATY